MHGRAKKKKCNIENINDWQTNIWIFINLVANQIMYQIHHHSFLFISTWLFCTIYGFRAIAWSYFCLCTIVLMKLFRKKKKTISVCYFWSIEIGCLRIVWCVRHNELKRHTATGDWLVAVCAWKLLNWTDDMA